MNLIYDRGFLWYLAALLIFVLGMVSSAAFYPGGYDWPYTVVSDLASHKHNPIGSGWFAASLSLSMLLLWPYISVLKRRQADLRRATRYGFFNLRLGIGFGVMVGVERLLFYDISTSLEKSHEIISLFTFVSWYAGILGLMVQQMLLHRRYLLPLLLMVLPLVAIGAADLWLYIQTSSLGWVDTSWRTMEIPVWRSFAFWQWIAVGFIWLNVGLLQLICGETK